MEKQLIYFCDNARHLVCYPYSTENLHKMAEDLGIKKCWYHATRYPHYDIPLGMIDEVKTQCILVRPREIFRIIIGLVAQSVE